MTRIPPNTPSSMIATVGYDPETRHLEVEFKASGKVYIYPSIPEDVYQELMDAPSAGKYFNLNIAGRKRLQP